MMPRLLALLVAAAVLATASLAMANHIPGSRCSNCASHTYWPKINGIVRKAKFKSKTYKGTRRNDELLGHHGSDRVYGKDGSDVLWGDWQGPGQPGSQRDYISGGEGSDFIYASHGYNNILGGPGNDAISAHYGRGLIDCGPGRDIYHVPKSLRGKYKVKNCEKVDRRPESKRGGKGLRPLR
jgi:Ca2+-binding RTX toxin-like protein